MAQSIFYKEWIKTRKIMWLLLFVSVGFLMYTQIRIERAIELKGVAHLWLIVLMKDVIFIEILRYIPLLLGIFTALAQYVPEIQHKRLKLTLHLPVNQKKIMLQIATFGLSCLLILFLIHYGWLWIYISRHFSMEFTAHILLTSLPWYVAGIAGYALTGWICLEPTWKYRIINTLFSIIFLRLLFLSPYPEAYNRLLWVFIALGILLTAFIWLSVMRFKAGEQDK